MRLLQGSVVYLRLASDSLVFRSPANGADLHEWPQLAVDRVRNKVLAVGTAASQYAGRDGVELVKPFAHPRTLVSDFSMAQELLKALMRRLPRGSWFLLAPRVILHPEGNPEGGWTQIEIRAMHELALGMGARSAHVWQGPVLTDEQLLSNFFPEQGKLLS